MDIRIINKVFYCIVFLIFHFRIYGFFLKYGHRYNAGGYKKSALKKTLVKKLSWVDRTSGTTGEKKEYRITVPSLFWQWIGNFYCFEISLNKQPVNVLHLWDENYFSEVKASRVLDRFCRIPGWHYYPIYSNVEFDSTFYEKLANAEVIIGYPSTLVFLARMIESFDNLDFLNRLKLQCIVSTGGQLSLKTKAYLSYVWRVPVFNRYGLREVGTVAHDCSFGNMHIFEFNNIVKIRLDNGTPELIVTNKWNRPIENRSFRTGDSGLVSSRPCKCGLPWKIIDNLSGRHDFFVELPGGGRLSEKYFLDLLLDIDGPRKISAVYNKSENTLKLYLYDTFESLDSVNTYLEKVIANDYPEIDSVSVVNVSGGGNVKQIFKVVN